jgi:hypothetical protein
LSQQESGATRVALDRSDVEFTREGLVITIRRSKTDQEAEGRKIGIPDGSNPDTCPIRSLQDWLERSGINDGPIFRPINRHGTMALHGYRLLRWQML